MKYTRCTLLSPTADAASVTSAPFDLNQIYKLSAQVVVGTGTATGTLKIQVSNDPVPVGYIFQDTGFVNWSDLMPEMAIDSSGAFLYAEMDMCYRALRFVYTNTDPGPGTPTASISVQLMCLGV